MKLKSEYYWFLIFAVCFFAYQQIQDNIRPHYHGSNSTIKYLLGVAPNFFPAIGIPAIFVLRTPHKIGGLALYLRFIKINIICQIKI